MIHILKKYLLITYLIITPSFLLSTTDNHTTKRTTLKSSKKTKKQRRSTKNPHKQVDRQKVMDYQMPDIIARYCKDYNVSIDTAKIHEQELKRFLILSGEDDDSLGMMSAEVDNLWHTFLLFTKEYQTFCNDMFGKFIHHCPKI